MARNIERNLSNCRLLKNYGSWLYCSACNKTVAYLCYTGYKWIEIKFECSCGSQGKIQLFESGFEPIPSQSTAKLNFVKNRYCCPKDNTAFFSIVNERVKNLIYEVQCLECSTSYRGKI